MYKGKLGMTAEVIRRRIKLLERFEATSWYRTKNLGGTTCSAHSSDLLMLAKWGLIKVREKPTYDRRILRYQITQEGISVRRMNHV